jgi:hypothetical protein
MENNMALPGDRVYFFYNHFHNALDVYDDQTRTARNSSLDRYTFGFEKTLLTDESSVEVRMPFSGGYDVTSDAVGVSAGNVGNLFIVYKHLLRVTSNYAFSGGLAVDVPTGGGVDGIDGPDFCFRIENRAVYLSPVLGLTATPTERVFHHAFAQIDVPLNGNRLWSATKYPQGYGNGSPVAGARTVDEVDTIRDHTLLYLDAGSGYWLYRAPSYTDFPDYRRLTGIAALLELHYTTSLGDPDVNNTSLPIYQSERIDILNLTLGMHFEFGNRLALRAAGVVPIHRNDVLIDPTAVSEPVRFKGPFDSELKASVICRF